MLARARITHIRRRSQISPSPSRHSAEGSARRLPSLAVRSAPAVTRRPAQARARAIRAWRDMGRVDRLALAGLAVVLIAGFVLRVLFMFAWSPAFMGFSDSPAYLQMASGNLWGDPLHPVGYPLFLRDLHALVPTAWFAIAIQHLFGLISAVLIWLTVRRAGAPRLAALLPAAVIALNGGEMFLEHSILTEPLFILLASICLYCASRAASPPNARWAAAAGLALVFAHTVRVVALPLFPVLVLWLALASGGAWRERLRAAAAALACIVIALGAYVLVQDRNTGVVSLTTPTAGWDLYGRVAPFADCTKFTPPPGTRVLCEKTPPAQRTNSVFQYLYQPDRSLALQYFTRGNGAQSATPAQDAKIAAFTRAVVENQPLDYARSVLEGMIAYVTPVNLEFANRNELGPGYDQFYHQILFTPAGRAIRAQERAGLVRRSQLQPESLAPALSPRLRDPLPRHRCLDGAPDGALAVRSVRSPWPAPPRRDAALLLRVGIARHSGRNRVVGLSLRHSAARATRRSECARRMAVRPADLAGLAGCACAPRSPGSTSRSLSACSTVQVGDEGPRARRNATNADALENACAGSDTAGPATTRPAPLTPRHPSGPSRGLERGAAVTPRRAATPRHGRRAGSISSAPTAQRPLRLPSP